MKKPTKVEVKPARVPARAPMVQRMTWEQFHSSKLLWWVNRSLHLLGWAIIIVYDDEAKKVVDAYPARVRYRGFSEADETEGFAVLSKAMAKNAKQLAKEAEA
jgi:hypothetical protein